MLVAGSRGAGKSSLLGAIMLELPSSQRILTIEDTLELPALQMQEMGYKVQRMFVQSSLGGRGEMSADDALRVSLRLGESAIVMGEVRGKEAKTLYEAMRAGTAGSTVLGTFHADSAQSVYERVVHDMGIPPKSFEATDIVIVAGLTRPAGSQRYQRRVVQVAEMVGDGKFQDLFSYDEASGLLLPTEHYHTDSKKIQEIGNNWGLTYEEAVKNIELRGKCKQKMVDYALTRGDMRFLSAEWVMRANNAFWGLVERYGKRYDLIENEWNEWFSRSVGHG